MRHRSVRQMSLFCISSVSTSTGRPCSGSQRRWTGHLHARSRLGGRHCCYTPPLYSPPAPSVAKRGFQALHRAAKPILMVLTESTPFELGTNAPPFEVRKVKSATNAFVMQEFSRAARSYAFQGSTGSDANNGTIDAKIPLLCMQLSEPLIGKTRTLEDISKGAAATLVMFVCNHCPFVKLLKGTTHLACHALVQCCSVSILLAACQVSPQVTPPRQIMSAMQREL